MVTWVNMPCWPDSLKQLQRAAELFHKPRAHVNIEYSFIIKMSWAVTHQSERTGKWPFLTHQHHAGQPITYHPPPYTSLSALPHLLSLNNAVLLHCNVCFTSSTWTACWNMHVFFNYRSFIIFTANFAIGCLSKPIPAHSSRDYFLGKHPDFITVLIQNPNKVTVIFWILGGPPCIGIPTIHLLVQTAERWTSRTSQALIFPVYMSTN